MIVNKKLDRLKQWAGEKMGGEVKTNVSDDFKALETEMNVRQEGRRLTEDVRPCLTILTVLKGWSVCTRG